MMNTYVDDCFAVLTTDINNNNIWKMIEAYILKMNDYYINNMLQMNIKKTLVMIITNNIEETNKQMEINGNIIKHNKYIKILGTTINEKLNWNTHINEGRGSLISQLKQRLNSLKLIIQKISQNFTKQIANALLISKLNYVSHRDFGEHLPK